MRLLIHLIHSRRNMNKPKTNQALENEATIKK